MKSEDGEGEGENGSKGVKQGQGNGEQKGAQDTFQSVVLQQLDDLATEFKSGKPPVPRILYNEKFKADERYKFDNFKISKTQQFNIDPLKSDKENLLLVENEVQKQEGTIKELENLVSSLCNMHKSTCTHFNNTVGALQSELNENKNERESLKEELDKTNSKLAAQNTKLNQIQDWLEYEEEGEQGEQALQDAKRCETNVTSQTIRKQLYHVRQGVMIIATVAVHMTMWQVNVHMEVRRCATYATNLAISVPNVDTTKAKDVVEVISTRGYRG